MSNHARRYLQQLGQSWYVRVKVPRHLQSVVGNTHIRKALGTRDLDKANELKWAHLKAIKTHLARIANRPVPAGKEDPLAEEAKRWRESLRELIEAGEHEAAEVNEEQAVDRAQEIEDQTGDPQRAKDWYKLATANTPLLSELLDKWLDGEHYKKATKKQHRVALENLKVYLGGDRLPTAVTSDVAADFVEDWLKKSGKSYNTQRRKLNSLVAFWKWLGLRRYVERGFNPWTGFVLSKVRTPKTRADKRPFTEKELVELFATPPEYEGLADVMVLGLYTGARIEELCSLRMQDVSRKGGKSAPFMVTLRTGKGKTPTRTIAVAHGAAHSVLARRWDSSSGAEGGQLFPSFKPGGYDGKLSWAVSKAFGRFRKSVGLPDGVDFHSFRRTFITALENLGVDQVAIARYVGHTLPTLAFTVYSGGATEETQLRVARRIRYSGAVERAVKDFLRGSVAR